MHFDSFQFVLFFLAVLGLVALLQRRVRSRNLVLLAASYFFYAQWDWRFLGLIIASTAVDYLCGLALDVKPSEVDQPAPSSTDGRRRRIPMLISIFTNLGLLGVFKYFDFFIGSTTEMLSRLGVSTTPTLLKIALPVGISFYTFQTLSYTIDLYRRRIATERSLLNFGLYVAFFPQLVAGPIERAKRLLPQFSTPQPMTRSNLHFGAYLIGWGLFKKVVLSDNVAPVADAVFGASPSSGFVTLIGVYAFAIQIYCDFSGYSDIARGAARCLGFDLMLNFNLPYFATNPSDFWRRWHISLSTWLRDYLYVPLGGNRLGTARTYVNLMATMVLGGLWHGAAWTFVVWGIYQGTLLCVHRAIKPWLDGFRPPANKAVHMVARFVRWLGFFHLICLGWLFFRADSMSQVGRMLSTVFFNLTAPLGSTLDFEATVALLASGIVLFGVQLAQQSSRDLNVIFRIPVVPRAALYACGFLAVVLFGKLHGTVFIYFQF